MIADRYSLTILARACVAVAAACAYAGVAQASPTLAADATIGGLTTFFADPENVRGVFGAAAGAIASVSAVRLFGRGTAPRGSSSRGNEDA